MSSDSTTKPTNPISKWDQISILLDKANDKTLQLVSIESKQKRHTLSTWSYPQNLGHYKRGFRFSHNNQLRKSRIVLQITQILCENIKTQNKEWDL
jgi:hypothetical protein